jgi:hypothetical protein
VVRAMSALSGNGPLLFERPHLKRQLRAPLSHIEAGAKRWQYQYHSVNDPQNAEQGLLTTRADRQRWRPLSAGHQGEFDVAEFGQHASFLL